MEACYPGHPLKCAGKKIRRADFQYPAAGRRPYQIAQGRAMQAADRARLLEELDLLRDAEEFRGDEGPASFLKDFLHVVFVRQAPCPAFANNVKFFRSPIGGIRFWEK